MPGLSGRSDLQTSERHASHKALGAVQIQLAARLAGQRQLPGVAKLQGSLGCLVLGCAPVESKGPAALLLDAGTPRVLALALAWRQAASRPSVWPLQVLHTLCCAPRCLP